MLNYYLFIYLLTKKTKGRWCLEGVSTYFFILKKNEDGGLGWAKVTVGKIKERGVRKKDTTKHMTGRSWMAAVRWTGKTVPISTWWYLYKWELGKAMPTWWRMHEFADFEFFAKAACYSSSLNICRYKAVFKISFSGARRPVYNGTGSLLKLHRVNGEHLLNLSLHQVDVAASNLTGRRFAFFIALKLCQSCFEALVATLNMACR